MVNRKENGKANSDIMRKIVSLSNGSARKSLVLLEKVINEEPEKAIEVLKSDGVEIENEEIINLCRALIKGESWNSITDVLNKLKKEDIENIRRAVLGYMSSVLLKGNQNNKAGMTIEFFQEPFYNSGFPGLVLACYQSFYAK
jgi:uncharacterized protein YrzB (UPF0473 family)